MPPIGTPPRRVGVAPPTVGLSNGRWPGNRAMGPTNQEASGQKKPLPPKAKRVVVGTSVREVCVPSLLECASLPGFAVDCIPRFGGVSSGALPRAVEFQQGRSPRLASSGFGYPGPCFWRLELREGVDDQSHARGQVASRPYSQPNYPPRLESRIKTRRGPFLFWVCVSVCGPVLSK